MSDKALAVREESRALTPQQERREAIRGPLLQRLPDLLPKGASPERFVAMTMQAIAKDDKLHEVEPTSILMAALEAAQYGLEPTGAIGGAHIVGFSTNVGTKQKPKWEKRAQLILDYRGVQHLIRRGGGGEVKAVLVYEGDQFAVHEGTKPWIDHVPAYETTDPDRITHVYAYPLDHPEKFEVMTKGQVDAIRARSKSSNNGPWVTDFGQQARKTVIKRLSNYMDLKPDTRMLLEQDAEREFGDQVAVGPADSRTVSVKQAIRARLGAGSAAETAADEPETQEQSDTPAPAASATQQPPAAATADEKVQAEEVCGSSSDPALGSVETCVLPPEHLTDGKKRHQSVDGTVWPA